MIAIVAFADTDQVWRRAHAICVEDATVHVLLRQVRNYLTPLQDRVDLIAVGLSADGSADDPLSLTLPAHDAPEGEVRQVPGGRNRRRILEFLE